jgi:hypothetical protein
MRPIQTIIITVSFLAISLLIYLVKFFIHLNQLLY